MTTRILPRAEYPRLAGTEADAVWPHLPALAQVLVVEDGDQIVGCWVLAALYHVECLWIHPDHRQRLSVPRRLWIGMQRLTASLGIRAVWTAATSDDVRGMLANLEATKLPGDHYVMSFSRE